MALVFPAQAIGQAAVCQWESCQCTNSIWLLFALMLFSHLVCFTFTSHSSSAHLSIHHFQWTHTLSLYLPPMSLPRVKLLRRYVAWIGHFLREAPGKHTILTLQEAGVRLLVWGCDGIKIAMEQLALPQTVMKLAYSILLAVSLDNSLV